MSESQSAGRGSVRGSSDDGNGIRHAGPDRMQQPSANTAGRGFSCFVIGTGSLALRCIELLLRRDCRVLGLIAREAQDRAWAAAHGIAGHAPEEGLVDILGRHSFEYLFSIDNDIILPAEVLALPSRWVINYHDSLLPRHAGRHAATWAILSGDRRHGITWHVAQQRVDAGDILAQVEVDISPDDTALTLNAKCYQAAITTFDALVADLILGKAAPRPQDLTQRTFHTRAELPPAGGVIDWSRPAAETSALVQALSFGDAYRNPLLTPKLWTGAGFVAVSEAAPEPAHATVPPGTVLAIERDRVRAATGAGQLLLGRLRGLDGDFLTDADLARRHGVKVGAQLPALPPEAGEALTRATRALAPHEEYWKRQLARLAPLEVPYLRETGGFTAPAREEVTSVISDHVRARLGIVPDAGGPDILLAAFAAYLMRLTRAEEADVGLRAHAITREIGARDDFFAPAVPLRIAIDWQLPFQSARDAMARELAERRAHVTYARDLVMREPALARSSGVPPHALLPVVLVPAQAGDGQAAKLTAPVVVEIPSGDALLRLRFDPNALAPEDAGRLLQHFLVFLAGIAARPQLPLGRQPLLGEAERRRVLVEWNDTARPYPRERCLHALVEEQVDRTPDAIAVAQEDKRLTYRELDRRANRLARELLRRGARPDLPVGLCVERSLDMAVGVLAILKAGAPFLPLDPAYPQERIDFMLADAGAALIVTQAHLTGRLGARVTGTNATASLLLADALAAPSAPEAETRPPCAISPRDLAYVMYTSGSTGTPKGVLIEHRSAVNHAASSIRDYGLCARDRVLQFFSISFDGAVEEIFPTWLCGAALVLRPPGAPMHAAEFGPWIERHGVTVLDLPTAYWQEWVHGMERSSTRPPGLLRAVIVGGEKASLHAYRLWRRLAGPRIRWFNSYGPTECTVVSTLYEPDPALEPDSDLPIGRPIANTRAYIVDPRMEPVPAGVPGELLLGGDGVARGYLNREDLTASRFVPDPFTDGGGRLYRTGDLAAYRQDGVILYAGRTDAQVKISGFRVEPGEVEDALGRHPAVRQAVVAARTTPAGDTRLVAYVVRAAELDEAGARAFLKERLPEYMLPATVVFLDAIPLTPSGKLDRRALPEPAWTRAGAAAEFVPPRTPQEKILAGIWSDVLGIERLGVHDNFFDLGGRSLLAIQLVERIQEAGVAVTVPQLFEAPTIAGLAAAMQASRARVDAGQEWSPLVKLRAGAPGRVPLFLVHTAPGDLLSYVNLVHHLDPGQPCYGFQSAGLGNPDRCAPTIRAMAEHYTRLLAGFHASGPLLLAGWCYGGIVAAEMATLWWERGRPAALLAVIDAAVNRPGGRLWAFHARQAALLRAMGWRAARTLLLRRLERRRRAPGTGIAEVLEVRVTHGLLANREQVYRQNAAAYDRHRVRPYPGSVTVFRPDLLDEDTLPDLSLGWAILSADQQIHLVPGDHRGLLQEPNVRVLARLLQQCVDRAVAGAPEFPGSAATPTA